MRRWYLGAILAIAMAVGAMPAGAAVNYQPPVKYDPASSDPQPGFCQEPTLQDFLAPLEGMPKLKAPPANGRLGFGPGRVLLETSAPMLAGEGSIGYALSLSRGPAVRPDWTVTTTLARVNPKGKVAKVLEQRRRRVAKIGPKHGAGVRFAVPGKPATYRLTAGFRNQSGRKLGGFGFYVLVVRPTTDTRLSLNAGAFQPGQKAFARVENPGTTIALFSAAYTVERLQTQGWVKAPWSPTGPWPAVLFTAAPGKAGPCEEVRIPSFIAHGRYRIVKDVAHVGSPGAEPSYTQVSAEFEILE